MGVARLSFPNILQQPITPTLDVGRDKRKVIPVTVALMKRFGGGQNVPEITPSCAHETFPFSHSYVLLWTLPKIFKGLYCCLHNFIKLLILQNFHKVFPDIY